MPRTLSPERRAAVLGAATRAIARDGLAAPTASIAAEAGLSAGSLFNYFPTKTALLNGLYLHLKRDLAAAVAEPPIPDGPLRERAWEGWRRWIRWGAADPDKQRVLMLIEASRELTEQTRRDGVAAMRGADSLFAEAQAGGPFADQPLEFLVATVGALAATTMEAVSREPDEFDSRCRAGFTAVWGAVGVGGRFSDTGTDVRSGS
ncbi:TetR/AcrR family transcriptional regulator [Catenuloplanes atrovinosus]|uniref:AcrR family transcriptional regulator n=1 Tax=Catenuloplanes atrovinosus TaxID=137266 RepID=A0AAE4C8Z7_9ACTN|nr:TetR/AcrR family transcriptional regulator [Catenuloplanes atrovinosus]MDR7275518.1 AcrR family transcriptional regulator [Catenuloplanes atrovinosus]